MFTEFKNEFRRLVREALLNLGVNQSDLQSKTEEAMLNLYFAYCFFGPAIASRPWLYSKAVARHVERKFWRDEAHSHQGLTFLLSTLSSRKTENDLSVKRKREFESMLNRFRNKATSQTGTAVEMWFSGKSYADISEELAVSGDFGRNALFLFLKFLRSQNPKHMLLD